MSSVVNPGADDRGRSRPAFPADHRELVARQKEQFGGMKFGSSFFGWLTATGTAVLLVAVLAAVGVGLGVSGNLGTPNQQTMSRIGVAGAIVGLVVILLAYFAGGYVAARMARFSGLKQGFGVWLWAVIVTIVLGVLGYVTGNQANVLGRLSGVPQVPVSQGVLAGVITVAVIAAVALVGALLGGLAGMRYHRRVDRVGFEG